MLKYEDIRDKIESGDIVSYKHRISPLRSFYDFKIWLIRVFTTSDVTHVGVLWKVGGRVFILEAVSSGVRIFPLSLAGDFRFTPRGEWSEETLNKALSVIGQPYSYLECGRSLFQRLKMTNGIWHCAKYLSFVLSIDLPRTTPETVMDYLEEVENLSTFTIVNPKPI